MRVADAPNLLAENIALREALRALYDAAPSSDDQSDALSAAFRLAEKCFKRAAAEKLGAK
jgi:hypothetical protein